MLILLLLIVALGLFIFSIVMPRRSRRLEHKANRHLRPLEQWANRLPGIFGWLAKSPFLTTRKVTKISTEKGRQVRDKLPGD